MPRFCDMRRVEVGAVWYHFLVNDTQSRWSRCSLISLFSKWHSVSWRIHLTESSLSVKSLFGLLLGLRLELTWILTCDRSQQKEGVVTECSPSQSMIDWLHLMHAPPPSSTPLRPSQQPKSKNCTLGRAWRQRTADWGRDRLDERQKQHAARNNATGDAQLRARSATTHLSLPSRCLSVSTSIALIDNI